MTTTFAIVDAGGFVLGSLTDGKLAVKNANGCDAASILAGVRHFRDANRMAQSLLNRWVTGGAGYEGGWAAAKENGLYVSINDGEATAAA